MAKKYVRQFRFFGTDKLAENYIGPQPNNPNLVANLQNFADGSVFLVCGNIYQLGIQALPGTRFYLNGAKTDPIIIGSTGIFELESLGDSVITSLQFDSSSLEKISESPNSFLIVDVICDAEKNVV